jgi:hypothetical protein
MSIIFRSSSGLNPAHEVMRESHPEVRRTKTKLRTLLARRHALVAFFLARDLLLSAKHLFVRCHGGDCRCRGTKDEQRDLFIPEF